MNGLHELSHFLKLEAQVYVLNKYFKLFWNLKLFYNTFLILFSLCRSHNFSIKINFHFESV